VNVHRSRTSVRLVSTFAAIAVLAACGATSEVKQSVAQRRAAEAQVRSGGALPAATGALPAATDTGTTGLPAATDTGTAAAAPGKTAAGTVTGKEQVRLNEPPHQYAYLDFDPLRDDANLLETAGHADVELDMNSDVSAGTARYMPIELVRMKA